jgi:hypothetical protein
MALARREDRDTMEKIVKLVMLAGALYGAYHSGKTALRLAAELFG